MLFSGPYSSGNLTLDSQVIKINLVVFRTSLVAFIAFVNTFGVVIVQLEIDY